MRNDVRENVYSHNISKVLVLLFQYITEISKTLQHVLNSALSYLLVFGVPIRDA
jgi:hypothetical protein